jgi:hypothetical protein
MYFSMQEERQVCSFAEREVEGWGIQVAKQFLRVWDVSVDTVRERPAWFAKLGVGPDNMTALFRWRDDTAPRNDMHRSPMLCGSWNLLVDLRD